MKYQISNSVYYNIYSFYLNVAKKYRNTFTQEDVENQTNQAFDSIYRIENGLLRRQPTISRWQGYYMANTDKWYYAYRIEGDTVYVEDACHAQNMHESKAEAELSAINEWLVKLGCLNEYSRDRMLGKQKTLLAESQESKSISAAKKLVMQKFGWDEQRADQFIRVELRQDIPTLRDKNAAKFILGVTRMFCDGQLRDARTIQQLNNTLKYVASDAHINEYDRDLNGMSAQDLIQRFAKNVEADVQADRNAVASQKYQQNSDYTIVPIDTFEDAQKYGDYTSWCVTHDERMFDSYTHGGIGQFYFCLRKGFENAPQQKGENCPLDEYGLSMVAVSVDEEGRLSTCTCRWNHDNGGNDNIMDTKQISQLIGCNFYEAFKPNNKWKSLVEKTIQRLKNGESPREVFDNCGYFCDGYAVVGLNDKWNWIDKDGNYLSSDQWFEWCADFNGGYAVVKFNGKYNWIDKDGNYLSPDQWFNFCDDFNNGYAQIARKGKWNWVDTKGNIVSPNQWFEWCGNFNDGYAVVKLNDKWNWIDKDGNYLSQNQWFDWCGDFHGGYVVVKLYGKHNWIDKHGNLLSPNQWFEWCGFFYDGYAAVLLNGKHYWIDKNGILYDFDTKKPIRNVGESIHPRQRKIHLSESDLRNIIKKSVR